MQFQNKKITKITAIRRNRSEKGFLDLLTLTILGEQYKQ